VIFALGNTLGRSRWGLSVPKKAGSAVERNRIKRRLREIMRRQMRTIAGSRDICVLARPDAARATLDDLRQELIMLSEKASSSRSSARTSA
jgi:ribonuclease P protein component